MQLSPAFIPVAPDRAKSIGIILVCAVSVYALIFLWSPEYTIRPWRQFFFGVDDITSPDGRYYLSVDFHARTGNNLFQYAVMLALAKRLNRTAVLMPNNDLHNYNSRVEFYKFLSLNHSTREHADRKWKRIKEKNWGTFEPSFFNLPPGDVMIDGYFCSWKYIENAIPDILEDFTPNEETRSRVEQVINDIHSQFPDYTLVGVHVRRGDFKMQKFSDMGYTSAPLSYFQNAFDYIQQKQQGQQLLFVVASNGMDWCKENLNNTGYDFYFLSPSPPIIDLLVIGRTSHVVVSSGTFGWWGAWLAGGWGNSTGSITVYYTGFPKPGSEVSEGYNKEDYYPPHWIGLGDS